MASYTVTDPSSGKTATLVGDSPPNEQELNEVFYKLGSTDASPAEMDHQSNYDVAGHSTTLAAGVAPEQATTVSPALDAFSNGLLTNKNPAGFAGHLGRGFLAGIGGGILGVPGAAAGEAIRQAVANTNAAMAGGDVNSPAAVVGNVALAGTVQRASDVAAPYIASGVEKTTGLLGDLSHAAYAWARGSLGGISGGTADMIDQNAADVAAHLGVTKPEIGTIAEKLRSAVRSAVDQAGVKYGQVAEAITNGPQAPVINLKGAIGGAVNEIQKANGYAAPISGTGETTATTGLVDQFGKDIVKTIPGKPPIPGVQRITSPDEAAKFGQFAKLINSSDATTPEQVYYLQRDINAAIRNNRGTTLAKALGEVKGLINKALPQMAQDSASPALGELAKANAGYAAAQDLEDSAHGLTNANDAIQYIKNAYSPNKYSSQAKDTLEAVGKAVPEVGDLIKKARIAVAAEEAGHILRPLPQTGAGAGIAGAMGAAASEVVGSASGGVGNVVKNALMVPVLPLFSPRAYLLGAQMSQAAAPSLAAGASGLSRAANAATPALAQALRVMAPASIAAFYRSPGQ